MRNSHELATLREQAVRLRREGKSRRQIKEILGFIGNGTLNQFLRDEPLPLERAGPGYAESIRDQEQRLLPRNQRLVAWHHDRHAAVSAMNTSKLRNLDQLRGQAVALRRAGKSVRQIKEILGPIGNGALQEALRGEPPPEWTRRPNAKDDLRTKARDLRLQGLDYEEIVARLGVSKSSVSLWVRDLPRPSRIAPDQCARRTSERMRRYWADERQVRAARRAAANAAAAADIGGLTDREILIAGAIAYWCEGAKNKPHRRADRVTFANSDPELISFFLLFLDVADIPRSDLAFQLQIHETADVASAERFWLALTGARPEQFRKTSLKRHNPETTRKNTSDGYYGCLRVDVMRSCVLYRKIEGWASAVMSIAAAPD